MDPELTHLLRCPKTGQRLQLEPEEERGGRVYSGTLICEDRSYKYPIRNFIPRFVPAKNYADNFGMQWNSFRQTQLDSYSGHPISAERFWRATKWKPDDLRGKWVLDVGCGAGRFAEIALQAGAQVMALDYSRAVEACHKNLQQHPNLHVIQSDIFHIPLRPNSFPFVYCLGVLQHTPDPAKAFRSLPPMLKADGRLVVDVYERSWSRMLLLPKYWMRPVTTRVTEERLFRILKNCLPALLRVSVALQRIPFFGRLLKRMVPVANYTGIYPLRWEQHLEWSLLDTFDWYAPKYDYPQTPCTLGSWFLEAGLTEIQVEIAGHLVGRGKGPSQVFKGSH